MDKYVILCNLVSSSVMAASTVGIAPVLSLVLNRIGPELDRIGASSFFGPVPVRYLHFCIAHMQ